MRRRTTLLGMLSATVVLAIATGVAADVPTPGANYTANPTADYGIVELSATYDTPSLIRYGSQLWDKDTYNLGSPPPTDVDRDWNSPYPDPSTTPPHYASQRTVVLEQTLYQGHPGHLLFRMTGGVYPTVNVVDVNVTDKWRQVQSRSALDTANDTPGGQFLTFAASFVVKAQKGQIKFIVTYPNGQPAQGAYCYADNVVVGTTDSLGIYTTGPLDPKVYQCKATSGMLTTLPLTSVMVTKGTITNGPGALHM
jgi:hypothetical protein